MGRGESGKRKAESGNPTFCCPLAAFSLVLKVRLWERMLTGKLSFAGGARNPRFLGKTYPAAKWSFPGKGRSEILSLARESRGKIAALTGIHVS
jgi:hypothetical protein